MGQLFTFLLGVITFVVRVLTERSTTGGRMWIDDAPSAEAMSFEATAGQWAAPGPPPSIQQRLHDEVAALQQIDPDFNELQFLSQAALSYQTVFAADASMDADVLSPVATPEFILWYRAKIERWRAAGLRRVVRDMKIINSSVMKVSIDGTKQAIITRLISSGIRFTQDKDTDAAVEGSSQSDSFTEFVTFVRPPGTTTPKSAGEGGATHCPSCGAPTTAGQATCPFCGTQLTGTGASWLLDRIAATPYA